MKTRPINRAFEIPPKNPTSHLCLDHSPPNSELWDTSLPTAPSPLACEPLHTLFPLPEMPLWPSPYGADSVAGAVHTP